MNVEEARAWLDEHGVTSVRTEGVSPDGQVMGKHLSRAKFERSLPLGPAVADLAILVDVGGTPRMGWWGDWRAECLGDIHQRPDLSTLAVSPQRPTMASCVVEFVDVHGTPLSVCSRSLLRRVTDRLADLGLAAQAAFELEGMVFRETFAEAREKGYRDLTPLGLAAPVAYLNHDAYRMAGFMDEVVRRLDGLGIPWEAWSAEAGPGQFELNFPAADPLTAADWTMRARQVVGEVAVDVGRSTTFMAKPSEEYGNGMHIHHSLTRDGEPAFFDASAARGRSTLMLHWIGGLMATMPAATSILSPTINSYRRMVDFAAVPTVVSWGEDNKSVALRTVSRSPRSARIEHRGGSGEINPHLALAAVLAGGITGVEQAIEPPEETAAMAWGLPDRFPFLPRTITTAADALEEDKHLADVLGFEMVEHWVNSRRWEWMMFHTTGGDPEATTVTDWELNRYFEMF